MKKIIQSIFAAIGICFITTTARAQLASDTPAMTVAQVEELRKSKISQPSPVAAKKTIVTASSRMEIPKMEKITIDPAITELLKQGLPAKEETPDKTEKQSNGLTDKQSRIF